MADREWLYYGVPVTTGRNDGPMYRFWRCINDGRTALCIEYTKTRVKPVLVAFEVDRIHISQRPSDPPPMPDWTREEVLA